MKALLLSAVSALIFASAAQAQLASPSDSRLLRTLPAGSKITVGQPLSILATTESLKIGTSNCSFSFNDSSVDRVTPPNMVVTAIGTEAGSTAYTYAAIAATTVNGTKFNIYCSQQNDQTKPNQTIATTIGDLERALEQVGGHIVLAPAQPFGL